MNAPVTQVASPGRVGALCEAALLLCARVDGFLWSHAERLSRRTLVGVGLLSAAIAALAYARGTDLGAGLAGSQPNAVSHAVGFVFVARDRSPQT
jgi:hypothetical protein